MHPTMHPHVIQIFSWQHFNTYIAVNISKFSKNQKQNQQNFSHITRRCHKKTMLSEEQYEREFQLKPSGRYLLTTEYMEMSTDKTVFFNFLLIFFF